MKEHARHRRQHTVRMTTDAVQLTIVFTVVPVIPFVVLESHLAYGVLGSVTTAVLFYAGYPLTFGALMWFTCPERKGTSKCRTVCETTERTAGTGAASHP